MEEALTFYRQIELHPDKDAAWFLFENDRIKAAGSLLSFRSILRKEDAKYIVVSREKPPMFENFR